METNYSIINLFCAWGTHDLTSVPIKNIILIPGFVDVSTREAGTFLNFLLFFRYWKCKSH
jgi:hypothetical protein